MIISADLNENDAIYTSGYYSDWLINETITRTYPDGVRETNHINITYAMNYTIPPDIEVDYFYSINLYDRATGIIVENNFEIINQTGEYLTAWSLDLKITESSVWVIPEFSTWLAWLAAIGMATIAVILGKRKLLRLTRDRSVISK